MIEIHNADPDQYRNTVTHSSVEVYDADDECLVEDKENEK